MSIAAAEPLPLGNGWMKVTDPTSNKAYYAHPESGEVSWTLPPGLYVLASPLYMRLCFLRLVSLRVYLRARIHNALASTLREESLAAEKRREFGRSAYFGAPHPHSSALFVADLHRTDPSASTDAAAVSELPEGGPI